MGIEIERKFLINRKLLPKLGNGTKIIQGYFNSAYGMPNIRIRINGKKGFITIKDSKKGMKRFEFEYEIDLKDAKKMLSLYCNKRLVTKKRYTIISHGTHWICDIFKGKNEGLYLAEVEVSNKNEKITIPHWITKEVTEDKRFYNHDLCLNPFKNWKKHVNDSTKS